MAFKHRYEDGWYKNAAGLWVQSEPVGTSIMSGAATGDVLCVASDDTVEAKTITAGTDITVTQGAGTITIASTASGGGGGGGATVLYDSATDAGLTLPANSIDTGAAGIAGGYDVLEIFAQFRTDEAAGNSNLTVTINADTGAHYDRQRIGGVNTGVSASAALASAGWVITCAAGANCASDVFSSVRGTIPFYAGTVAQKSALVTFGVADTTAGNSEVQVWALNWRSTAAMTRMAFAAPSGKNLVAGSRVIIYGR